jgi:hypothetical protein
MELKWERVHDGGVDMLKLVNSKHHTMGWLTKHVGSSKYGVSLAVGSGVEIMECEKRSYVTLREAMRALKAAAIVLTIGGAYGT